MIDEHGNILYGAGNKDFTRNLWQQQNQQSLRPYDNYMKGQERIEQLRSGNNLFLDIENNPQANSEMPAYRTLDNLVVANVNNHEEAVEKYAKQYNVDPDLVKAIMYNEAATGHWFGFNNIKDILGNSKSQMPMNIRGDTWSDFEGNHYDTKDAEQNIELGVQVIKKIQDSIHNPTPAKVATVYNSTGAMEINDYGARTEELLKKKPWLRRKYRR